MVSKVEIGRLALSNIGHNSDIESLAEDSAEASEINKWYSHTRKIVLEAFDWSFARTRLALTDHNEDPPDGVWSYRYIYPADCIKVRKIQHPTSDLDDAVPFEIELDATEADKTILTNIDDAIAVYTADIDVPDLYSAHFIETFAARLGAQVAYKLTNKRSIRGDQIQLYNGLIRAATAVDANERVGAPPRDADWIRKRN